MQTNVPWLKFTHCVSFEVQSAQALFGGKRCRRRTASFGSSIAAFRRRWVGVGFCRASPGLASMVGLVYVLAGEYPTAHCRSEEAIFRF